MERKGRILYVEDDDSLRKSCSIRIAGRGYEVLSSHNGKCALDHFLDEDEKGRDIDLVITDWHMRVAGGRYLITELRKSGYWGDIAIKSVDTGSYKELIENFARSWGVFNVSSDAMECLKAYQEIKRGK
jgi:CheY-like chemotaxis protein